MNKKEELSCLAALSILAYLVFFVVFLVHRPTNSEQWAAWMQAFASIAAIVWAGSNGVQLLNKQRNMKRKAAEELAVSVLRSVHTHLEDVGEKRWWPGEKLRNVAEGRSFFRVEYLEPIEALLDQVSLQDLGDSPVVGVLVRARTKIWRLRELLTWVIVEVEKVQEYEKNGRERFNDQSKEIKKVMDELFSCVSELTVYMKKYESPLVIDS